MARFFSKICMVTAIGLFVTIIAPDAVAKKIELRVDSKPAGAEVSVYNTRTDEVVDACIAPCVLTFKRSKKYIVRSKMPGKIDRGHKVTKWTGRGGKTLLFLMRSREEQEKLNKELAQAREKYREQNQQRAKLLAYVYQDIPRQAGEQDIASDKDAQPLIRVAPVFPPNAESSGHCRVKYDVLPNGHTTLVEAFYCTEPVFKESALRSAQKWKYAPKLVNGEQVRRFGVQSKITFKLTNAYGRLIPENPTSPPIEP